MITRKLCTAVFVILAAALFSQNARAERTAQLKVVDQNGKTLVVTELPPDATSVVRAIVHGKNGQPQNGVAVSLVDLKTKKTVATTVTGSTDLSTVAGFVADAAPKGGPKSDGGALFPGIRAGEYQLVFQDKDTVAAFVDVFRTSAVAATAGGGAAIAAGTAGGAAGGAAATGAAAGAAAAAGATVLGVSAGTVGAVAAGVAAVGGVAAAASNSDDSSGDSVQPVPTPLPTVAPTPAPTATPRPPRPSRPHPASPS